MGHPKIKWTEEEEVALLAGVEKHGPGKWKNILKDPEFAGQLSNRSNIDLKDKWRNISVAPDIQGSKDKIRTPKIKAAAFQLAAVAAASSTPTPSSNHSPLPSLPRTGSDLSIDDSCNVMVDSKNAPRNDGIIFEALSALTDANGSDVTAIYNFIVQKGHEVPPLFKRILGSRLRRLASQGKLEKVSQLKSGTQNFYKMNDNSFLAMRTPVAARPKEVNVKPRQTNSQGPTVSQEKIDHAAGTAAFKFYEVDEKLEVLNVAVEERDRMIELAEQAELILLLAEELHKECSEGKIVALC